MSSKFSTWLIVWVLAGSVSLLTGCGGETEVASNTPTTPPSTPPSSSDSSSSEDEQPAPANNQASYGSETGSGANAGMGMGGGYGDMAGMGGMEGYGDVGGAPDAEMGMGMGGSGYPGSDGAPDTQMGMGLGASDGYGDGYGMGSSADGGMYGQSGSDLYGGSSGDMYGGMEGGMPGMGGQAGGFGLVSGFVRQNCFGCHGRNNPKGGVTLEGLSPDMTAAPQEWLAVADALESDSMPPRNARQPDPRSKARVIEFIRESLGSAAEVTFMQRAEMAMRKGETDKAAQLFYAQVITADESEVSELANHFRLYRPSPLKPEDLTATNEFGVNVKTKLVTQLPLGVAIILKLTGTIQVTDVKPVGVSQINGDGGGGEMGGMDPGSSMRGGRGGGAVAGNTKLETFEDLTGDIGRAIVAAFESRRSSGNFGTLFSSLGEAATSQQGAAPGGGFDGGGFDGGGYDDGMEMAGGGRMGSPSGPGMSPDMGSMGPDMGGMGFGMGMEGGENLQVKKTKAGNALANGLVYLGKVENINNLLKKSIEAGVDGVIVIEIDASKNRNNIVTSNTRMKFMLPSGKVVGASSKSITNTDIDRAIARGQDVGEVQKQVDLLFGHLDRILKLTDLPAPPQLPAASAMKQLHTRFHSGPDHRLQVLAEARMYNAKGIISAEQLEMVYQVVFEGNEGTTLATGSTDDRKLVLTSFTDKL